MNSYVVNLYPVPNDGFAGEGIDVTSAAAASFTGPFDPKTSCVMISVMHGDMYVTFDGSLPSVTNGIYIKAPYINYWSKEAARVARMIAVSGQTAHVRIVQFTY
jgi:hypothetical protein